MALQVFQTVASSQPLFFLDRYDDGPLKSTHWQSQGREGSIIVELLKQASVPLCLLISWLLSKWTWICNIRQEIQKTTRNPENELHVFQLTQSFNQKFCV